MADQKTLDKIDLLKGRLQGAKIEIEEVCSEIQDMNESEDILTDLQNALDYLDSAIFDLDDHILNKG